MFSSLAKYIFGGGNTENAAEEAVECETHEVNDWLLVNLPDQTAKDMDVDIDYEEEDDKEEETNDIEHYSFDINEDEDSREENENEIVMVMPVFLKQEICDYDKSYCELQIPYDIKLSFDCPVFNQYVLEKYTDSYAEEELPFELTEMVINLYRNMTNFRRTLENVHQLAVNLRTIDTRTCHPAAHSRNCTSQPALSPKAAELLERIKDLKPAQQALEHEKKKYISRSQLNRQNRNYIYQSSTKTNRRKNLQRHHSGANNNRRC